MPKHTEKGNRLKQFFENNKPNKYKTKKDFAIAMGIHAQDVNKYFDGYYDPLNLTEKLVFEGCNIEWLVTGEENNYISRADASIEARITRLMQFINDRRWNEGEIAEKLGIRPEYVDKYLTGKMSIYDIAGALHNLECDVMWVLTGMTFKEFEEMNGKIKTLEHENTAFRRIFTTEMIKLIFDEFMEPIESGNKHHFPDIL